MEVCMSDISLSAWMYVTAHYACVVERAQKCFTVQICNKKFSRGDQSEMPQYPWLLPLMGHPLWYIYKQRPVCGGTGIHIRLALSVVA